MLSISTNKLKYYLYVKPTDMRKSFDGLIGLVHNQMELDSTGGDVFIFINRRRDRIKLLIWSGDGFWIHYKRLETCTFQIPNHSAKNNHLEIGHEQLMLILEGIDLNSVRKRARYHQKKLA
ncbi:IS66 family insertion sequence element accessory protein TnpB [Calditrichota bacterium LG24]